MRIIVEREAGRGGTDVTEAVQIVYDTLLASMDFSSGFLGIEELDALAKLGEAAGFGSIEEIYTEIAREKAEQERIQQANRRRPIAPREAVDYRAMMKETEAAMTEAVNRQLDRTTFYGQIHTYTPPGGTT